MNDIKVRIRNQAIKEGFDAVGFTATTADPKDREGWAKFIKKGWHGEMKWLARNDGIRGDITAMMPDAKTAIVLAVNYGPKKDPLASLNQRQNGTVSVYAQTMKDYHNVIKKRMKQLSGWITLTEGGNSRVFIDTAPVMEKPLAQRAGVGWQGKHSNLVSQRFGSWLFLGEIITTLEISPDLPEPDHCGSCQACIDICPTNAIPEPYHLDATRCISYLTIEHKSSISLDLMPSMGNHIFGCDDCLAVCPWNKFSTPTSEPLLTPRPELTAPRLADLAEIKEPEFRKIFAGSPIKRTGRDRFIRNVLIAIGNSGEGSLRLVAEKLTNDTSDLVSKTAQWALDKLKRKTR